MLFEYRGEIVPSFPLQAIMLWLRITPADVKIELGSKIILPNGWHIPIHRDGTITINPVANQSVRRLTLNELLLAAQEHEKHRPPSLNMDNLKDHIVLLRLRMIRCSRRICSRPQSRRSKIMPTSDPHRGLSPG